MVEVKSYHCCGSGGDFARALLDEQFKENMTLEEAKTLAIAAISLASMRDESTGGSVRWVELTQHGSKETFVPHDQLPYQYK